MKLYKEEGKICFINETTPMFCQACKTKKDNGWQLATENDSQNFDQKKIGGAKIVELRIDYVRICMIKAGYARLLVIVEHFLK